MWLIPVSLYIVVGYGIGRYLIKKRADDRNREQYFVLQYLCCAIIAIIVAGILGQIAFSKTVLAIMAVGFVNALACYCQWQAIRYSLSKTSLFTLWDDLLAMGLAFLILGERRFFSPILSAGVALSLLAVALFAWDDYQRKKTQDSGRAMLRLYGYIAAYSVIWGIAIFLMRLWASASVPPGTFLFGWYVGSFIGALLVYRLSAPLPASQPTTILVRKILPLSVAVVGSLALGFWSYSVAPLVVVQPIFLVAEIIIPTLVGLVIYREHRTLRPRQWLYFALGIGGAVLAAASWAR